MPANSIAGMVLIKLGTDRRYSAAQEVGDEKRYSLHGVRVLACPWGSKEAHYEHDKSG